ncbi:MAG: hypothetical protein EOM50_16180, partial [Erysipelotrichia bacterium]|nr:hypothetical protein [Erysipelotrichia bacterium]
LNQSHFSVFVHAASTGEEVYSLIMYNQENFNFNMTFNAAEYEINAFQKIRQASYDKDKIEIANLNYIDECYLKYLTLNGSEYLLDEGISNQLKQLILYDYTKIDSKFLDQFSSDIVFCNNSLLYHEHIVQEQVLNQMCQQANKILIITGAENKVLEKILKKHHFIPYKKNWESIYDGWKLRRKIIEPIYPTPTTPYLTTLNKYKNHYFKYSIFVREALL